MCTLLEHHNCSCTVDSVSARFRFGFDMLTTSITTLLDSPFSVYPPVIDKKVCMMYQYDTHARIQKVFSEGVQLFFS